MQDYPATVTVRLHYADFVSVSTLVRARISDLLDIVEPAPATPDALWYANKRYLAQLQELAATLDAADPR